MAILFTTPPRVRLRLGLPVSVAAVICCVPSLLPDPFVPSKSDTVKATAGPIGAVALTVHVRVEPETQPGEDGVRFATVEIEPARMLIDCVELEMYAGRGRCAEDDAFFGIVTLTVTAA
jgi:hypothetical protein